MEKKFIKTERDSFRKKKFKFQDIKKFKNLKNKILKIYKNYKNLKILNKKIMVKNCIKLIKKDQNILNCIKLNIAQVG